MSVAQRFKSFRKKMNLSPYDIASEVKVTATTIYNLEGEKSSPKLEMIERLGLAYPNLNMNWLIKGDGTMFIDNKITVHLQGGGLKVDEYDSYNALKSQVKYLTSELEKIKTNLNQSD